MIDEHPILTPLYVIGIPAWLGAYVAGPIGAAILAVASTISFVAWRHGA